MATYNAANPFLPITTPYRATLAAGGTAYAAFILAALNALSGALIGSLQRPVFSLIGSNRTELGVVHFGVAALAMALGLAARRRATLWLSWVVLAWSIVEGLRLTAPLYAHASGFPLAFIALIYAGQGLRGVITGRRFAAHPPEAVF